MIFTLVLASLGLIYGCSETQKEAFREIFHLTDRNPELGASAISYADPISLSFSYPVKSAPMNLENLFTSYFKYGSSHTAGAPDLSEAVLSWSDEFRTLTISGIQGWENLSRGAGPKAVEIESIPEAVTDIFDHPLQPTTLWKFTLAGNGGVQITTPEADAANVSIYNAIYAIFSEEMDAATINASSFTLRSDGGQVTGSVTYDAVTRTAAFIPAAKLSHLTRYVAAFSNAVKDKDGNTLNSGYSWSFTTAPQPGVSGVDPVNGADNISLSVVVTATFETDMDASTLNTSNFTLSSSGGPVSGSVSYDTGSRTASFTPASYLNGGTTYTARLNTSVLDSAGQPLSESDYTWFFMTGYTPQPSVAVDSMQATFTWSPIAGATQYNLYWSETPGVTKDTGLKVSSVTSPYTHTNLTNGKTYYYVMTAVIGGIEGPDSEELSASPITKGAADTSFDGDGAAVDDNAAGGNGDDYGYSMAIDSNRKILVSGYSKNSGGKNALIIWRYNINGSGDTGFGTSGIATGGATNKNYYNYSMDLDTQERILTAGDKEGSSDIFVVRFSGGGILDNAFGISGIYTYESGSDDYGYALTVDDSDRAIFAGTTGSVLKVGRLTASGTLDATFGAGGIASYSDDNPGLGGYRCITLDSSGRILVTGSTQPSGNNDMTIWRYASGGTLDSSFGSGGVVVFPGSSNNDMGYAVTTDPSGKILVAGYITHSSGDTDMAVWRYNSDGSPDTTFGGGAGYITHDGASGTSRQDDYAYSLAFDLLGKIVVAGSSKDTHQNMVVWRLNGDGSLDTTFNSVGYIKNYFNAGQKSEGYDLSLDNYGRIVVCGFNYNAAGTGNNDMVIWRIK